jgi:diacylglycerol kinase (ATP)
MEEEPVKMDINQINDRYFVYTVASGVLTRISYDISRRTLTRYGYLAYVLEGVKDLMTDYRFPLEIEYGDKTISGEFMMVLGLCSTRVGGFRLKYFSKPKLNDGLLELMLFRSVKQFRLFKLMSFFLKRGRSLKENEKIKGSSFVIKTTPDVVWNADGELSTKGSITIKVLQQQIYVFAHPKIKRIFF